MDSFAAWHLEQVREGLPWARSTETAREIYQSMQPLPPSPAEKQQAAEVTSLRAEVASLRGDLAKLKRRHAEDTKVFNRNFVLLVDTLFGDESDEKKHGVLSNHTAAIKQLQQRAPDSVTLPSQADLAQVGRHGPPLFDAGLWDAERGFRAGDVCTFANAAWVAKINSRGLRPGATNAAWRLLNKSDVGFLRRVVREELTRQTKGPTRR